MSLLISKEYREVQIKDSKFPLGPPGTSRRRANNLAKNFIMNIIQGLHYFAKSLINLGQSLKLMTLLET